jgi:hypothetical protein
MFKPGDIVVPNIHYKQYPGRKYPFAELFEVMSVDQDPTEVIELELILPVQQGMTYECCFPWRFDLIHRPNV